MKQPGYEGILVALVPQRGTELVELLRDASRQALGERELRGWTIEHGNVPTPPGRVVFRLSHPSEAFPFREGLHADLARAVSKLSAGRCWALALAKAPRTGQAEGWADGVVYDRGERVGAEESAGQDARAELLAWFGEQLAMSENEVLALFESCEHRALVTGGGEQAEDELELVLERARREFARYRSLRDARQRQQS